VLAPLGIKIQRFQPEWSRGFSTRCRFWSQIANRADITSTATELLPLGNPRLLSNRNNLRLRLELPIKSHAQLQRDPQLIPVLQKEAYFALHHDEVDLDDQSVFEVPIEAAEGDAQDAEFYAYGEGTGVYGAGYLWVGRRLLVGWWEGGGERGEGRGGGWRKFCWWEGEGWGRDARLTARSCKRMRWRRWWAGWVLWRGRVAWRGRRRFSLWLRRRWRLMCG